MGLGGWIRWSLESVEAASKAPRPWSPSGRLGNAAARTPSPHLEAKPRETNGNERARMGVVHTFMICRPTLPWQSPALAGERGRNRPTPGLSSLTPQAGRKAGGSGAGMFVEPCELRPCFACWG